MDLKALTGRKGHFIYLVQKYKSVYNKGTYILITS